MAQLDQNSVLTTMAAVDNSPNRSLDKEDKLLEDTGKLCELFERQNAVNNEIISNLTGMCLQLTERNASDVREIPVPEPVRAPEGRPAEVPRFSG